jgi:hypothetical protein
LINGRAENIPNTSVGKINMNNIQNNQPSYLDLKQIKKIEPKRVERPSNKVMNKNAADNIKIDNLNAKTAEIMKTSPGLGTNFQNNLIHTNMNKTLINVSINNSNKIVKEDISNYEKNLFKHGQALNMTDNKNENQNSLNMNNQINPTFYHNQKRKYNQITNEDYLDKNCHTPLQNVNTTATPLNQMNKMRDINELMKTKKFKYY